MKRYNIDVERIHDKELDEIRCELDIEEMSFGKYIDADSLIEDIKDTWFYKNCKTQRKRGAKICDSCPFRELIESFAL